MLKEILPEILKDTKFEKDENYMASYNDKTDKITFDKKRIMNNIDFNMILQMYFHKKMSRKEILLIVLLHELGHRYSFLQKIDNKDQYDIDWQNMYKKHGIGHITKWNLAYWQEIRGEREAMTFAKEYFFRYRLKEIIKRCLK